MPLVRRRVIALPLEHMAQMPPAVGAHDLGAHHAVGAVLVPRHRAGDAVEVGRPAAPGRELVPRRVQRRVAPRARVHPGAGRVLVVGAAAGGFGALFAEDAELSCFWGLV